MHIVWYYDEKLKAKRIISTLRDIDVKTAVEKGWNELSDLQIAILRISVHSDTQPNVWITINENDYLIIPRTNENANP